MNIRTDRKVLKEAIAAGIRTVGELALYLRTLEARRAFSLEGSAHHRL